MAAHRARVSNIFGYLVLLAILYVLWHGARSDRKT